MILKETYGDRSIHDNWGEVYRRNPHQDRLNERMMHRIFSSIDLPANALCLDAGCGTGKHTPGLLNRGFRCVGVDLSMVALRNAVSAASTGRATSICFAQEALETLSFKDEAFDLVYCRGVLMHIPDWSAALVNLCRVLKRGGKIVILESNHRSVEASLVRSLRRIRTGKSTVKETDGGLEFWSYNSKGLPYVVRIADIQALIGRLRTCGIRPVARFATEFWDLNRFPSGALRSLAARYNQLWLALRLPPGPSLANAVIGVKDKVEGAR